MRKWTFSLLLLIPLISVFAGLPTSLAQSARPPTPTPLPAKILSVHSGGVTALAWSPDGSILASSSGDYTADDSGIHFWSPEGKLLASINNLNRTYSLDWSPDGTPLAAGSETGDIRLYERDGTSALGFKGETGVVYTLDWSPDGTMLAAGVSGGTSQNQVQVWGAGGDLLHTLWTNYSGGKFYNVAWSPDGNYLIGGAVDYSLWRADGTPVFTYERCQFCTPAWGFAWSPDSSMWGVGNESGEVMIFSVTGAEIASLRSDGNVDAMAWSPDGEILAGGSSMWFWDGAKFEKRGGSFNGRPALAWSPDGQLLAASDMTVRQVRVVNREGNLLARIPLAVNTLAWSPDGQILAAGLPDGTLRLWELRVLRP